MSELKELKKYLLEKKYELENNSYRKSVEDYTNGCIDMITDIFNKVDELEHPDIYE